jgi:hypothetical protein
MAGTINLALTQQFDQSGRVLSGGKLNFFAAGTSTPQSAFIDSALTLPHPNPIILDSGGRVPMFYLADGTIKIRLSDKNGVTITAADNLLVIGPSAGGGGGGGAVVDPNALMQTGDIKARYGTGTLTGYVRCNGNSIGLSSGTEAFGSTLQALFEYLWPFPNITLNTAKGATANADWLAGRLLNLPDLRGRAIAGMDDMGASAAARLTVAGLGVAGTVLGNADAAEVIALATNNIAAHTHSGTTAGEGAHTHTGTTGIESANHTHIGTTDTEAAHTHGWSGTTSTNGAHTHTQDARTVLNQGGGAATGGNPSAITGGTTASAGDHTHTVSGTTSAGSAHAHTFSTGGASGNHVHFFTSNAGTSHAHTFTTDTGAGTTGAAFSKVQPTMVLTFYMKV